MFRYYAERFTDVDVNGNVLTALVKWSQENEAASEEIGTFLQGLAIAFLATIAIAQAQTPPSDMLMLIACGLFVLGVLLFVFDAHLCTEHCMLTFDSDGLIRTPRRGLGGWLWGPWVYGDHRSISSIQIEQAEIAPVPGKPALQKPIRYAVWIYFEDGGSHCVADGLNKHQAYQVAVLMDQARLEMRDAETHSALHGGQAWAEIAVE